LKIKKTLLMTFERFGISQPMGLLDILVVHAARHAPGFSENSSAGTDFFA